MESDSDIVQAEVMDYEGVRRELMDMQRSQISALRSEVEQSDALFKTYFDEALDLRDQLKNTREKIREIYMALSRGCDFDD
jgi:hypothetical protein